MTVGSHTGPETDTVTAIEDFAPDNMKLRNTTVLFKNHSAYRMNHSATRRMLKPNYQGQYG